jgi:hypothetical protein
MAFNSQFPLGGRGIIFSDTETSWSHDAHRLDKLHHDGAGSLVVVTDKILEAQATQKSGSCFTVEYNLHHQSAHDGRIRGFVQHVGHPSHIASPSSSATTRPFREH